MNWFESLFFSQDALQAVVVICLIIAAGLTLGRIKFKGGISLGVSCVFFIGIVAGHFGLKIDSQMLHFAENFGLVFFVYALGLQVGPGFFNSFVKGGLKLNVLGLAVILIGTVMTVALSFCPGLNLADMVGVMCGATTNTPALGAAQQTLGQLGMDASSTALGCAVTYPLGVLGVIIAMVLMRKVLVKASDIKEMNASEDNTFIATYVVHNPAVFGKCIKDIAPLAHGRFVISRIWRDGVVSIPNSESVLLEGDRILIVTSQKESSELTIIFGEQENKNWNTKDIDWNKVDDQLESHRIVVTKPNVNGKSIAQLRLRNRYGINISRVHRAGMVLLATPDLVLQMGDRLIVVGREEAIQAVENEVGNTVKNLREPNLVSICVGIVLGLILGAIPVVIPGISAPVKLGLAGGPIIVGLLMGAFGPRVHMVTYITESANLMLRRLGLSMYLACLGIDAGAHFVETVAGSEGLIWIGLGFAITVIPVLLVGVFALKVSKLDFGSVCGMLCGSMANPMALTYATDSLPNNNSAVAYTTVYPLSMFVRVIVAQLIIVFFI